MITEELLKIYQAYTGVPATDIGELANPYKFQLLLSQLPETFSTSDFFKKMAASQDAKTNHGKKDVPNSFIKKVFKSVCLDSFVR